MGNDVIVIGELNADLIAGGLDAVPMPGQEIVAGDFTMTLGSSSAIFACGINALGRGVTFVSLAGTDSFGDYCVSEIERRGIDVSHIRRDPTARTGVTIVLSTSEDRAMVTYPGAIADLTYRDLDLGLLDGHRHLHLTSYYLQTGLKADFPAMITAAKKRGLTVSFDPNSDPAQLWGSDVLEVIRLVDILFINENEAIRITSESGAESALSQLADLTKIAVMKRGRNGAIAAANGTTTDSVGFDVFTVDTTGAGDSFAAGFVDAFLDSKTIAECLVAGNACGALSTTAAGGTAAQPNKQQLNDMLRTRILAG